MQDQNQSIPEPQAQIPVSAPAKIVDIMAQPAQPELPAAPVAAPDPELVSEPAIEPAPAPAPVEAPTGVSDAQPTPMPVVKKQATKRNEPASPTPTQPKQPSTVPIGAIVVAVVMFLVLATAALLAFRQGF